MSNQKLPNLQNKEDDNLYHKETCFDPTCEKTPYVEGWTGAKFCFYHLYKDFHWGSNPSTWQLLNWTEITFEPAYKNLKNWIILKIYIP